MKSHFFEISFLDILISTSSHTKLDDRNKEKKTHNHAERWWMKTTKAILVPLKWNSSLCSFWIELLLFYFRLHSSIIFSWFERFILYLKKKTQRGREREPWLMPFDIQRILSLYSYVWIIASISTLFA